MRYQVPQFIEVEDKIVGPLTLKQFIYLAGAAGMCVVIYRLLNFYLAILLIVPVASFGAALAFLKINNRPFILMVESFFMYIFSNKLYTWRHEPRKITPGGKKESSEPVENLIPRLSNSKLRDLTWSLDIMGEKKGEEEERK